MSRVGCGRVCRCNGSGFLNRGEGGCAFAIAREKRRASEQRNRNVGFSEGCMLGCISGWKKRKSKEYEKSMLKSLGSRWDDVVRTRCPSLAWNGQGCC